MSSKQKHLSQSVAVNTSFNFNDDENSPQRRVTPNVFKKQSTSKFLNSSSVDMNVSTQTASATTATAGASSNSSIIASVDQKVKVFIRSRPLLPQEDMQESSIAISKEENSLIINEGNYCVSTTFDKAFIQDSTQTEVFQEFLTPITQVLQGFNFTVFAYGQTGSGKTYTMFGSDWESLVNKYDRQQKQQTFFESLDSDENFAGVIPRTIFTLFNMVQQKKADNPTLNISIYCSFLQIYNEKIFDLLQDNNLNKPLSIHESKLDGIFVEGLSEYHVQHYQDSLQLMKRGEKNRMIRSTSMNAKSSRSHTIFQLIVETVDTSEKDGGVIRRSRINLCDLAGSEKINKSEVMAGGHFNELRNINLSLTTLGKVIHSLSSKSKLPIPFRESKLTRILQESLMGNTITYIVATISPSIQNIDETVSTLKFAERARHITLSIKPNQINAKDDEIVKKLQKEILYLKEVLNLRRKGASVNDIHGQFLKLQAENEKLKKDHISLKQVEKLIEENRTLKTEIQQIYMTQSMQKDQTPMSGQQKIKSFDDIESPLKSLPSISNSVSHNDYPIPPGSASGIYERNKSPSALSKSNSERNQNFKSQFFSSGLLPPQSQVNSNRSVNIGNYFSPFQNNSMIVNPTSAKHNGFLGASLASHTPVKIRIKGRQDYAFKNGYIEMNQHDLNQQEKTQKDRKRILERLDQLDRIQKYNQEKLQKELDIIDSIDKKTSTHHKKFQSIGSGEYSKNSSKMSDYQKYMIGSVQERQQKQLKNYELKIKNLERRYFSQMQINK